MIRNLYSLSRGERNGLFVLVTIIVVLVPIRLILPRVSRHPIPDHALLEKEFSAFRTELVHEIQGSEPGGSGNADGTGNAYQLGNTDQPGNAYQPGNKDRRKTALEVLQTFSPEEAPREDRIPLHPFDPNRISVDSLVGMGLSRQTAIILERYRRAGGCFRKDSDLLRIYTMNPWDFRRLQPWIDIPAAHLSGGERALIEINGADSLEMLKIQGIGPVFARRIIAYRNLLGGFHHPDQLMEVYGMEAARFSQMRDQIRIDSLQIKRIDLNRAERSRLNRHPYLNDYHAAALVSYREAMGAFTSLSEIPANLLIPDSIYRKLRPYLSVNPE